MAPGWPCCDGTRMALLEWHCSWHYWESPHWNGTSMVSWDWLHWNSTERVLLKQWHWDGLARMVAAAQPWDGLTGMVALGLPWDDFTGMVAPGQPWNSLSTRAVGLVLHRWPCQDGIRVASLGQHWGGLPSTCALSLSPHNCPIHGFRDLPSCWSLGSGEVRTGAAICGTGALHEGGFGHLCFGGKLQVLGESPLLLARVLKIFHFMPSNFQTYNLP